MSYDFELLHNCVQIYIATQRTTAVENMADHETQLDGDTVADAKNNQQDTSKSKEDAANSSVPYYKLFSFGDSRDYLLMSVGTVSAIGNGLCMPLMTVIMGEVINSFGETTSNKKVVGIVSKVRSITYILFFFFFFSRSIKHVCMCTLLESRK